MDLIAKILEANCCGDIFDKNEKDIREKYREYVKQIHPDVCNDSRATEAMQKLTKLYYSARENLSCNTWKATNVLYTDRFPNGLSYRESKEFELGIRYVSDDKIIYVFNPNNEKYINNFRNYIRSLNFKSKVMEEIYKPKVPLNGLQIDKNTIYISKSPLEYPMDSFISAYKDELSGRDIAWMISRMCDFLCFLHNQGIVMNSIKADNLFINPDMHSISLYGGWWYATYEGMKMIGTTKDIYNLMPTKVRTTCLASCVTDIESTRSIFREIIKHVDDLPPQIYKWIKLGSTDDPIMEYRRWNTMLDEAYGPRQFKVFSADADKIYFKK